MKCPGCGNGNIYPGAVFCGVCGALISSELSGKAGKQHFNPIIWETDKRSNAPFQALFSTIIEIILRPSRFFRQVASENRSALPAFVFGLATGSIGVIAGWLWAAIFIKYEQASVLSFIIGNVPLPAVLIGAPVILNMQFVLAAFYIKIVMYIGRLGKVAFSQIFRMLCYAEGPMTMQVIPVIGATIGAVFQLYDILTGLHFLYSASRWRVFFTLLLPFFIVIGLVLIIISAGLFVGLAAALGLFNRLGFPLDLFR